MKKTTLSRAIYLCVITGLLTIGHCFAGNEPDSVYLFSYTSTKNNNHNGLQFAWSRDRQTWFTIGDDYSFLQCDYGRWGSEKRMISPSLLPGADGLWHCVWQLNEKDRLFAHAASADLIDWGRQSYTLIGQTNFLRPVLRYEPASGDYIVYYTDSTKNYYRFSTKDFRHYTEAKKVDPVLYGVPGTAVDLPGGKVTGQIYRVSWAQVDKLIKTCELDRYKGTLFGESTAQDAQRFAALKPVQAGITLQA
ncbi:MAG: alpha-L-arabinofuranosidase, partial [Bacteroidetes bacterium]|nr:alpha-L-arabinofuranosidase [Bacteroidota bacterium]